MNGFGLAYGFDSCRRTVDDASFDVGRDFPEERRKLGRAFRPNRRRCSSDKPLAPKVPFDDSPPKFGSAISTQHLSETEHQMHPDY
jgi:hypothetical protein